MENISQELKSLKDLWVCSCKSLDAELIGSLHLEQLHWNSDSLRSKTFIQMISGSPQLKVLRIGRGKVCFDLFKLASTQLEEIRELYVTCELLVDSKPVVHFKNLTKLVLYYPKLKPSHFKCIGNISTLKFLQCVHPVTWDDFKNICQGQLIHLDTLIFDRCGLSDQHMTLLQQANLPSLTSLDMKYDYIFDDGVFAISQSNLKKLRFISLSDSASHVAVIALLERLDELIEIELQKMLKKVVNLKKVQKACQQLNKKVKYRQ